MKNNLLLAIGLISLFASCDNKIESTPTTDSTQEISFTSSIGSMTRVESNNFEIDDQISVFASSNDQTIADNVAYIFDGSIFSSTSPIYLSSDYQELAYTAIYPYDSDASTTFTFKAYTDQSTAEAYELSDLLIATTGSTSEASPELTFAHAMSSIKLSINSNASLTNVKVTFSALYEASCDITNSTYVGTGEASDISPLSSTDGFISIVAPQTIAKGSKLITIETADKTYVWATDVDYTLTSGKQYSCEATINMGTITINGIIEDWDEGEISGGMIDNNDDSSEELDPTKSYIALADVSASNVPINNTWVITDAQAETTDFAGLSAALETLADGERKISFEFPNMTIIPDYALFGTSFASYDYNSTALVSLSAPVATSIGKYAFAYCNKLTTINIPEVETIGNRTFMDCYLITTVDVPKATTLDIGAFYYCIGIKSINIPEVTVLNSRSFYYCTSISTVDAPKVESVGDYAFDSCTSLTSINMPLVKSIGKWAFDGCSVLTTVSLPLASDIGYGSLSSCELLTTVSLPSAVSFANSVFLSSTAIKTLEIATVSGAILQSISSNILSDVTTTNIDLTIGSLNSSYISDSILTFGDFTAEFKSITIVNN